MIIQNARRLDNEELLKEYNILKVLEASTYYDVMEHPNSSKTVDQKKEDINYLHTLRCEISRIHVILLKRGFRNI
jgi:hypothetical protein